MIAAIGLVLRACAGPTPDDIIQQDWPAYSGTYEVRDFGDGGRPRIHEETIEFSAAAHWRLERDDIGEWESQIGDRYCHHPADAESSCEEVARPVAPSYWLQQAWPRLIPGDVAERWTVDREDATHVARLVVDRPCNEVLKPDVCLDLEEVISNELFVRFDRHGIPYHWYEMVDGQKTLEIQFQRLVVDGEVVIRDDQ